MENYHLQNHWKINLRCFPQTGCKIVSWFWQMFFPWVNIDLPFQVLFQLSVVQFYIFHQPCSCVCSTGQITCYKCYIYTNNNTNIIVLYNPKYTDGGVVVFYVIILTERDYTPKCNLYVNMNSGDWNWSSRSRAGWGTPCVWLKGPRVRDRSRAPWSDAML